MQISVTGPKFVIICATRTGANLGVFAFKISVLRQKVVICPTHAGANLGILAFKIKVLRQKLDLEFDVKNVSFFVPLVLEQSNAF